ncbi:hypothetical protein Scep_012205 [Stephania cephalantha]|uniref:Uncharacterized protein n=1 Tax=Stephania cephalantha TaxID=152367 RepID=A0AAP0JGV2_9MAGN
MYTAAVRKEISDETDRETGRSKQISSVPIHLSIYSPNGEMTFAFIFFNPPPYSSLYFSVTHVITNVEVFDL